MSEHYFTAAPSSGHDERHLRVRALGVEMEFVTDAGVFSRDGLDAGTRALLEALPPLKPGDLLIHGHTHLPVIQAHASGVTYLNPGSCALPKEGNPPSYMTFEDGVFEIKDLQGRVLKAWDSRVSSTLRR